jgi:hypothetical protein
MSTALVEMPVRRYENEAEFITEDPNQPGKFHIAQGFVPNMRCGLSAVGGAVLVMAEWCCCGARLVAVQGSRHLLCQRAPLAPDVR